MTERKITKRMQRNKHSWTQGKSRESLREGKSVKRMKPGSKPEQKNGQLEET
jgi:hypothetical protein